jgi:peptide/nickel transport system substrate-binding protein
MISRRYVLGAAATLPLAAPSLAAPESDRVMRFIPQSELNSIDPAWIPAANVRTHGYLVFDTLYGIDGQYKPQPQMVESASVENDDRLWQLRLRPGLAFHDGTPVLARDCVASINRFCARDSMGQALMAATDELSAPDDRTIRFRLKRKFPLLPDALVSTSSFMCAIMPERLAQTDPFKQVTEMIGSGPYRYLANERVPGARVAYARNTAYRPRDDGPLEWTAGPKIAHFDRIEWSVISDAATASAALQNGEADRWEYVNLDLVPLLRQAPGIKLAVLDQTGLTCNIRMNQAIPPFDKPAVRQAVLRAVNQEDYMVALAGADPSLWRTDFGFFTIGSPMATTVGLEVLHGRHDPSEIRQALADAGYRGEKVGILVASDVPTAKAASDVCADMLHRIGMNVDYLAMDWGMVAQRRMKKDPEEAGGWNIWIMPGPGLTQFNPVVSGLLRTGSQAYFGWPTGPRLEELRNAWLEAPDLATRKAICEKIQLQAFIDLPMIPLGQYFQPTAYRTSLTGVLSGFATFWNVRRG